MSTPPPTAGHWVRFVTGILAIRPNAEFPALWDLLWNDEMLFSGQPDARQLAAIAAGKATGSPSWDERMLFSPEDLKNWTPGQPTGSGIFRLKA